MRVAVAALAIVVIASAAAVALQLKTQPLAVTSPAPVTSNAPTGTPQPSTSCRVLRTPEPNNPTHAPVNGQPSLGVPIQSGVILVEVAQCRDIKAILIKYGLAGPATRYIDVPGSDEMIANGATRWYRIAVTPGTESATVVELYRHPEDIEYVQLLPQFTGGAAG